MSRPKGVQAIAWTTEKVDFVRRVGREMDDDQVIAAFAERYGVTPSAGQIKGMRCRYKIPKPVGFVTPYEAVVGRLTVTQARLGAALGLAYEAADALEASGRPADADALRADARAVCSYVPSPAPPGGRHEPESLPAAWPEDLPRAAGNR